MGTLLLFHLITQIFHLFILKAPLLLLLTLYKLWSFLETFIFQLLLKILLASLFWNSIILSSHWELLPHKILIFHLTHVSLVLHVLREKMIHLFLLIQIIALFLELLFKTNSNPKSNLVLKDHSKSHILPVSAKRAIPRSVSVSSFCVSSTLPNSSDTMVQKPSFDSYLFMSSSFTYSASQRSLRKKRSVFRVILVRIFLAFFSHLDWMRKNVGKIRTRITQIRTLCTQWSFLSLKILKP